MFFGNDDRPVYARLPDGRLHEVMGVEDGQIALVDGSGLHDVIVIEVGDATAQDAADNLTGEVG